MTTWTSPDSNPHGNAYWMAYREAQNMTDEQIAAARRDVAGSIAHANQLLAAAQGRDAGLRDVQRERRDLVTHTANIIELDPDALRGYPPEVRYQTSCATCGGGYGPITRDEAKAWVRGHDFVVSRGAYLRDGRYCSVHGIDLVPPDRTMSTRRYCPKCPEGSPLGWPSDAKYTGGNTRETLLAAADKLDRQADAHGEGVHDYTDLLRVWADDPARWIEGS